MATKNPQAKRISAAKLKKATTGLTALGQIKDYNPQRKEFSGAKAKTISDALAKATSDEIAAQNAVQKARDAANKAEWDAYNFMVEAGEQVAGQYGSNSDEYASLGYKKKSEYKKGRPSNGKKGKGNGDAATGKADQ